MSKFRFIIGPVLILFLSFLLNCSLQRHEQNEAILDSLVIFENAQLVLGIDLAGGAFRDLHLKRKPINPFGWTLSETQMPSNNRPYTFDGHFLCTGRWGAPSPGELSAGIPHNGEVNTMLWKLVRSEIKDQHHNVTMSAEAPLERLDVERKIMIPDSGCYFLVSERFTNNLPIGRLYNVVQHGTIAPPFLTENTIIHTNATRGFDQRTNLRYLEDSSFCWPNGKMPDGSELDLSRVIADQGYVTSHIFEDSIGWITASSPEEHILMGYIWKTSEYPWLNVWHQSKNGRPFVQGLEFGTTGLGQPYRLLIEENSTFFGRNSYAYIDAGETVTKSWICFMIIVPQSFEKVTAIELREHEMVLAHTGGRIEMSGNFNLLINE